VLALVCDVVLPTTFPPLFELADWSVLTWADWSTLLDAPPGSLLTLWSETSTGAAVFETVEEFV
jgi:hypothetical protein